eukprot:TRINITY_DN22939_c0_g1_i1.p1 TRINITY_DN22939_c0_g1~~TRINITY_DN22939_c0_g1_i1.p1  ORF type:complete len:414 (+),score=35.07 TRINITY_DN22939_c0_g1_i1:192-1433(+)
MNRYQLGDCIGQGCYGNVHRAVFKETARVVAIKLIQNSKQVPSYGGLPCAAYRETKSLQRLQPHEHIVRLYEVFPHGGNICIVTDLLASDLGAMMKNLPGRFPLPAATVKSLFMMLMRGIAHIHKNNIIHRDIKPSNLLISKSGILKIGDFGLARSYKKSSDISRDMTHEVGTKWYRAPELLLGCRCYGSSIDIWSCGCVLAEMISGSPLFPGTTEIDQIITIIRHLGTPSEKNWPDRNLLPDWSKVQLPSSDGIPLSESLPSASEGAVDVLGGMLQYYGVSRLSAMDILRHKYFFVEPEPVHPSQIWVSNKTNKDSGCGDLVWKDRVPIMVREEVETEVIKSNLSTSSIMSTGTMTPHHRNESSCSSSSTATPSSSPSNQSSDGGTKTQAPSPSSIVVPRPPSSGRFSHPCR